MGKFSSHFLVNSVIKHQQCSSESRRSGKFVKSVIYLEFPCLLLIVSFVSEYFSLLNLICILIFSSAVFFVVVAVIATAVRSFCKKCSSCTIDEYFITTWFLHVLCLVYAVAFMCNGLFIHLFHFFLHFESKEKLLNNLKNKLWCQKCAPYSN